MSRPINAKIVRLLPSRIAVYIAQFSVSHSVHVGRLISLHYMHLQFLPDSKNAARHAQLAAILDANGEADEARPYTKKSA